MPSWKLKAAVQRVCSAVPGGHRINYLLQRHVTHGVPISDEVLGDDIDLAVDHIARLTDVAGRDVRPGRFFEFGAGWDRHGPQILWCLGVDHQVVVDVRPLARPELVLDIARRLASCDRPELLRRPPITSGTDAWDHLRSLGIDYRAPSDARATGLPAGSIDVVTSTNTLEHIPPRDIVAIYREARRLLAPDGLMSFQIDYRDHYSYFDPTISIYNFLQYSEQDWARFSPDLHFQNRLRHADHLELLTQAGLLLLDERATSGDAASQAALGSLELAGAWQGRSLADLAICESRLVVA
jgi:hypothetical protein